MLTRLETLDQLVEVTQHRVPEDLTRRAAKLLARADRRLALGEQTVVALAGATGSGKSSLTNVLSRSDIAGVGVRRPTTSQTLAISFGPTNKELLDWLDVHRRHEVPAVTPGLENLVLLDLPDHDSATFSNRDEVDRLVQFVDQFVWVLDPEKYADAAVHHRYLQPLARHRDVVTVVLNKADRLSPDGLYECMSDLRRILKMDGLGDVPLLAVSAREGMGIAELETGLADVGVRKSAARARLSADITAVADEFEAACRGEAGSVPDYAVAALDDALAASAGVPEAATAVERSFIHRGVLTTGWPPVSWLRRLRPDPLKALLPSDVTPGEERLAHPGNGPVSRARIRTGLRALADRASQGMAPGWADAVGWASSQDAEQLPQLLERAVAKTDLGADENPVWWRVLRILQWVLMAALIVGLGWLLLGFLGLPPNNSPVPWLLLAGSIVGGVVLGLCSGLLVRRGARAGARAAERRLRQAVSKVGATHVVEPVAEELRRLREARELIGRLRK